MKGLIRVLAWLLGLGLLLAAAFAILVVSDRRPQVPEAPQLTASERAWAQEWLRQARAKPAGPGEPSTLTLTEPEANSLLAYLMDRLGQGRAHIELGEDRARLTASLPLPWEPSGSFVNLALELSGSGRPPRIERLELAGVGLPRALGERVAEQVLEELDAGHRLQSVEIRPHQIRVTYASQTEAPDPIGPQAHSPREKRDRQE